MRTTGDTGLVMSTFPLCSELHVIVELVNQSCPREPLGLRRLILFTTSRLFD